MRCCEAAGEVTVGGDGVGGSRVGGCRGGRDNEGKQRSVGSVVLSRWRCLLFLLLSPPPPLLHLPSLIFLPPRYSFKLAAPLATTAGEEEGGGRREEEGGGRREEGGGRWEEVPMLRGGKVRGTRSQTNRRIHPTDSVNPIIFTGCYFCNYSGEKEEICIIPPINPTAAGTVAIRKEIAYRSAIPVFIG